MLDQPYLDHLEETLRAASAIVDRVMPINVGSRDDHTQGDRRAQRQVALDNLLMDMLDQPRMPSPEGMMVGPVDPKSPLGQAILGKFALPRPDRTLEDTGLRGDEGQR